jgi:hypothetical protein
VASSRLARSQSSCVSAVTSVMASDHARRCHRHEGRDFAARWRRSHRFGQCTYRRGPGFVAIRDIRPEGPHRRVLIEAEWAYAFITLLAGERPADPLAAELLDELVRADLAVRLATGHHVLPVRLHRWPIPYNDV